uniref:Uncharacterized protein n=1 Tax=Candidatus Methanogaster sp. ANME-2c ERB4 TaxID=2759911 RepID=A0A7G9YFA5_9EURY|nr:hypothetical protein BAIACGLI_00002 [Methanosarcinales archaeon ANME-2c ERB4]
MVSVIVTDFLALVFVDTQYKMKAKEINFPISAARYTNAFILSYTLIKRRCYGILNVKHLFQRIYLDLEGYSLYA